MTLDDKAALGCRCMGVQMFNQEACDFPGLGGEKIVVAELNLEPPVRPTDLPPEPAPPVFPDPPEPPADNTDPVQNTQFK